MGESWYVVFVFGFFISENIFVCIIHTGVGTRHIDVLHRLTFSHRTNSVMSAFVFVCFSPLSLHTFFGFRFSFFFAFGFLFSFTNLKSVFSLSFVLINALVHINMLEKGSKRNKTKEETEKPNNNNEKRWKQKNQPELTISNIYFSQRFISSVNVLAQKSMRWMNSNHAHHIQLNAAAAKRRLPIDLYGTEFFVPLVKHCYHKYDLANYYLFNYAFTTNTIDRRMYSN